MIPDTLDYLGYWDEDEVNTSYKDISDYLLKYHKFKISYSTICKLYNKIEKGEIK